MATPNPPSPSREPGPPPELPQSPPEPTPSVAPPEVPAPSVAPAEPAEPIEPLEPFRPDPPMPEPGFPVPIWDAVAPPPSRNNAPSVTRGAADLDTGEVPLFDPLEAPSDAW